MQNTPRTVEQIVEEHVDALRHLVLDYRARLGAGHAGPQAWASDNLHDVFHTG